MTAQMSRAAADHGLLPQMFARTRAGDTPVAGLITAGLVRHASVWCSPSHRRSASSSGCSARPRRCSACSCISAPARRRSSTDCAVRYVLTRHRRRVLHLRHRLVERGRRSRPRRICLVVLALFYLPAMRRKYLLPDAAVRTGTAAKLRERHDDAGLTNPADARGRQTATKYASAPNMNPSTRIHPHTTARRAGRSRTQAASMRIQNQNIAIVPMSVMSAMRGGMGGGLPADSDASGRNSPAARSRAPS